MQRASETIGAIAASLAKAQCDLTNPERTLTATITDRGGERSFRYASLASGLDLVRKALGQQDIAVMQSTGLDHGHIMLTTLLVHASGEWVSSLWPVCPASESSAHVKGAALTYARRYALFTLVGIAGEDDLDAPDIPNKEQPAPGRAPPQKGGNGSVHAPPTRDVAGSAGLRDRLLQEIAGTVGEEALAVWAKRAMPLKNQLTEVHARAVEAAYLAKLNGSLPALMAAPGPKSLAEHPPVSARSTQVIPLQKPVRRRSKAHLAFVASQPCLVCQTGACDAHHLKMAQPRSLGRKVSDEFTVPLCRRHHNELHRQGNEAAWWQNQGIDPLPVAVTLWQTSPAQGSTAAQIAGDIAGYSGSAAKQARLALPRNDETKPILRPEAG